MANVIVLIGAGSIGQAIARRISAGKKLLLADLRLENADAAAGVSPSQASPETILKVDLYGSVLVWGFSSQTKLVHGKGNHYGASVNIAGKVISMLERRKDVQLTLFMRN
jgi:hypothetical protein